MEDVIEVLAIIVMLVGLIGIMVDRIFFKKGISVRVIQLIAVIFIIPTILILSIEDFFDSDVVGVLLGAIVGFILSGVGRDEANLKS